MNFVSKYKTIYTLESEKDIEFMDTDRFTPVLNFEEYMAKRYPIFDPKSLNIPLKGMKYNVKGD